MSAKRMCLPAVRNLCLASLAATPLLHAQSAWLDFDGLIPGESTDGTHPGWINIEGFELAGMLNQTGGFKVNKLTDKASPLLFKACAQGTKYPKVTLDLNRTGIVDKEIRLARILLEEVMVTEQTSSNTASENRGDETIQLQYGKITYTYYLPDSSYMAWNYDNVLKKGGTTNSGGSSSDTDTDGMDDAWESANGLVVGVNDANGDLDGDGLSNINEFRLGTNPSSGNSFFKATLIPNPASPGTAQLTWNSVPGKTYVVEWSPNLKTSFSLLETRAATETTTTTSVGINSGTTGFYRVRLQSP